jgi:hypothetical protein
VEIRVYQEELPARTRGSKSFPYPLAYAYYFVQGARDTRREITFEATGPDAGEAVRRIDEVCADPPRYAAASREYRAFFSRRTARSSGS